jgi:predicted naringenin-chalcone synthase
MIPSLCAHLLPDLGFRPDTKRLPITELGCAAGAVALSRAREFCQAYPGANVLIVATELCSLTFQPGDASFQALVGAVLFGDGAAACVVRGADCPGFRLLTNDSFLFPDSLAYMGFDVRDTGLHLLLDKGIPGAVERQISPVFNRFLEASGVGASDVDFFCIHPGGRRILLEVERVFGLEPGEAAASWECLAEVGNLSSASIFVVLRNLFERHRPSAGERGFLAAFGPGFSVEMCLGRWSAG